MIFAAPWVLLALPALPLLWWLLRVTPPAPRSETFPAIRLLMGLHAREETPARTPWWLLALRMIAATLVIVALARPVLDAGSTLPGSGPVLLVVDNGWASASDWPRRMQAANTVLDRVERTGRQAALLPTARDESGSAPQATAPMPVADLRARLAALHPEPWPPDRATATAALQGWNRSGGSVTYIGDGLTHGGDFPLFAEALRSVGPVTELRWPIAPARLLLPPQNEADGLVARMQQVPQPLAGHAAVLAQSGDGRTLARASVDLPAGAATGTATIALPPELRNRLSRLVLEGPPSAASIVLLDERWRRRPVGLVAGDVTTADTPFAGPLYYLRRALTPFTEVREADLATLLQREVSVLILADKPLPAGPERDALTHWVEQGGLLIRFAGPRTAEQPIGETDQLMPVKLLGGDRQLGGALSWAEPAGVAQFPASSPFDGLPVPDEVKVNRQVLAEPSADLAGHTWAALADGTPLVTQATRGAGRIVLFHVTANADWSNLPLSGLFVDMLRRLVALSAGVATTADNAFLAPAETLDGYGLLSTPPQAATGLPASEIVRTVASPRHPPGLYGPENGRRALNLGANLPAPEAAPAIPGARIEDLGATVPERALGPWLLAGAIVLLAIDLLIALGVARAAAAEPGRGGDGPGVAGGAGRARIGQQPQPGACDAARLYRDRRRAIGRRCAGGTGGSVGIRQSAHRRGARGTRCGRAGKDRSQLLSAALLADQRRCATAHARPDRGVERLHEPWRHHPSGYPRFRFGGRLRPWDGLGVAAGRSGAGHPAAGAADDGPRAGPRVLPAAGFSRALHRRAGVGAARPGPGERQREPGDHRRQ